MPTLLIADDSMFQRFIQAKVAREAGFTVVEAKDGIQCLQLAGSCQPDLLLLDLNMPGMGGLDVLKSLRQEGSPLKVLVLTADIQDTTRKLCEDLGVTGFINKPVSEDVLRERLLTAVG